MKTPTAEVVTTKTELPLSQILAEYQDGEEHGWDVEFAWLDDHHPATLWTLAASIREFGIKFPVLLGNDGRVWDGHHRLRVASLLGIDLVPVEIVPAMAQ